MKRSEINAIIRDAIAFLDSHQFRLPPFAYFTPKEWQEKNHEYDEIRNHMLGWDITDFGSGDFEKVGLFLFTIRNGKVDEPDSKPYAEKIMIVRENQVTPYHFHSFKTEDIINRGGGVLVNRVYNSNPDGSLADTDVHVQVDGRHYTVPAGSEIRLQPGQSLTNTIGLYHSFWAEGGTALIGEVSKVNDDTADNHFLVPCGRFPAIEEDEEPLYLLCSEYPAAKD